VKFERMRPMIRELNVASNVLIYMRTSVASSPGNGL
jgi:hypothetical protein